jgi:putative transposase
LTTPQIPVKTPNKNAYIESFHSIIECECYRRNCFDSFEEAFTAVDRFIRYYNNRRIHGSLLDYSPAEYLQRFQQGLIQPEEIRL